MTLDQLRYFQAVCQYNSVSRASVALNISQPSVSSAISKLENEFDLMLFTRQNKRLVLTKEGAVLLNLANGLLKDTDNIVNRMNELKDNKVLNLGIPPMLCSLLLPLLYDEFFTVHPDFKINIIEDDRSGLVNMLVDNKIDMAFLPHENALDSKFDSTLLTELDNVCCVHKNHILAKKGTIKIEDLRNEKLIMFKNSFFQTERILDRFKQNDITPNVLLNTAQVSTIQSMVSSGLGIGFIFSFLLGSHQQLKGIPLDPPMRTKVSLAWKQSEYLSDNMLRLIKFVKNHSFSDKK